MKQPIILILVVIATLVFGNFLYWFFDSDLRARRIEQENIIKTTPHIELSSEPVSQGEVLVVKILGDITSLRMGPVSIPFSQIGAHKIAVISLDTRASVGARTLTYGYSGGSGTATFDVVSKEYPTTRIIIPPDLAAQGVTSGELIQSIAQSDSVSLADIVSIETEQYYVVGPFVDPLDTWIEVGGFGTVREDRNGSIRHLGTDLDCKKGDAVYATNRGVVVYAGELQNFGKSIVIDHGVGIFSIYLHLSSIQTRVGKLVEAKEKIGAVGNTGAYTLEPHLHFSLKVHGTSVNPRVFIDTFNAAIR